MYTTIRNQKKNLDQTSVFRGQRSVLKPICKLHEVTLDKMWAVTRTDFGVALLVGLINYSVFFNNLTGQILYSAYQILTVVLPHPTNGLVNTSYGSTFGCIATYSCNIYWLHTVWFIITYGTCRVDGNWTHSKPV